MTKPIASAKTINQPAIFKNETENIVSLRENPGVRVGDVWIDKDPRYVEQYGVARTVTITGVDSRFAYGVSSRGATKTRISLDRMWTAFELQKRGAE